MPIATGKIAPMLWFDTQAEEAANFYVSVFKDARITMVSRYPEGAPKPKGSVMTVAFELFGQPFTALNAGPHVTFNEAISLVVSCDTQAELDDYWDKLTSDGGKQIQCGWLQDKFGLRWQVVPAILPELVKNAKHPERVMHAVWSMTKLDIATLKAATEDR